MLHHFAGIFLLAPESGYLYINSCINLINITEYHSLDGVELSVSLTKEKCLAGTS